MAEIKDRQFPVLNPQARELHETIPWSAIARFEDRAFRNHGQHLEKLASRGGLDWFELYCLIADKNLRLDFNPTEDWRYYRQKVLEYIGTEQNIFIVPVEWTVCGLVAVRASNAKEACDKIEQDNGWVGIPQSPYCSYIEDSFHVSCYEDNSAVETCQVYTDEYRRDPRFNLLNDLSNEQTEV